MHMDIIVIVLAAIALTAGVIGWWMENHDHKEDL